MRNDETSLRGARRRGLHRSLTLLQVFLGASAVILVAGAIALGWTLTHAMRAEALQAERTSLTQYVDGVVGPAVVHGDRIVATKRVSRAILHALRASQDVVTVKVWRAIFWRSQKLNNLTGLENALRLLILLLFAAYFVMPLVWLALAPSWSDGSNTLAGISHLASGAGSPSCRR